MPGNSKNHFRPKKKNKYRNIKCVLDGYKFDSIGESHCYAYLKLLQMGKEIEILSLQEKIYLTEARILYKPDFTIYDLKDNRTYWIDFKGPIRTVSFNLKLRLWKIDGPGELVIMQGSRLRMKSVQQIISSKGQYVGRKSI
jgi:hypothetical protein